MSESQVYGVIGEEGFARLIGGFYKRVPGDSVLGPMYKQQGDLAGAEMRLKEFLIQRFGGPERYSEARGHPKLRLRHGPFPVDGAARDRWIALMDQALVEAELPEGVAAVMRKYFADTATFLINRGGNALRIIGGN